jgi:hypothetical protein
LSRAGLRSARETVECETLALLATSLIDTAIATVSHFQ